MRAVATEALKQEPRLYILGALAILLVGAVVIPLGRHTPAKKTQPQTWSDATLSISEHDLDVMVRTIIGEAANEPDVGKIAVCHVILNRARTNTPWYGGNNVADVARHKAYVRRPSGMRLVWQFEPWMTRRKYLWGIQKHSTLYQSVKKLTVGCINGTYTDPTDGATHFLEPAIVRSRRGGTLPAWASGEGRRIGRHVFYKPYGEAL